MSSCGVTGIGNADAERGISTAMTTIAPTPSVLVERRIKVLINECDIMENDIQWWSMGNRAGQEDGDDLERGKGVDGYCEKKRR